MKKSNRQVWLAHHICVQVYGLFKTEQGAKDYADGKDWIGYVDGSVEFPIKSFCVKEFEKVTGAYLKPGEYCPIEINIRNLL